MNIFVCIKPVPSTETTIKIQNEQVDYAGIAKWEINPYDTFAIEEALKLKQAQGGTVTAVSLGPKKQATDVLRTAMAMGADQSILVEAPTGTDIAVTAKALAAALKKQDNAPDIIFAGKVAIDDSASAVPQMLAEFLETPHTTVVSSFKHEGNKVLIERDIEGGAKEIVELTLPAVIAANRGLNTPRYASLPGIMKAKKKPITEMKLDDLGISTDPLIEYVDFQLPPEKPPVEMISGEVDQQVSALVSKLRDEAKIL